MTKPVIFDAFGMDVTIEAEIHYRDSGKYVMEWPQQGTVGCGASVHEAEEDLIKNIKLTLTVWEANNLVVESLSKLL